MLNSEHVECTIKILPILVHLASVIIKYLSRPPYTRTNVSDWLYHSSVSDYRTLQDGLPRVALDHFMSVAIWMRIARVAKGRRDQDYAVAYIWVIWLEAKLTAGETCKSYVINWLAQKIITRNYKFLHHSTSC